MAAGVGLEGQQQAYRLIVRFPRSINLGDAVDRWVKQGGRVEEIIHRPCKKLYGCTH